MAALRNFKCKRCGYSIESEEPGHYSLMSGEIYNFKCKQCKEIVCVCSEDFKKNKYGGPSCPICGSYGLVMWNPVEGHCPKCGGQMELDKKAPLIFAD